MSVRGWMTERAGFALVDLLVSIAVAGLAGSVLVGLVTFLERHVTESERRTREHEAVLVIERAMRSLISSASPFAPGMSPLSTVAGNEHEVTVVSTGLPILSLPRSSSFRVRQEGGPVPKVILRWRSETGVEQQEVVLRNVTGLHFAYLPLEAKASGSRWRSQWRAEDGALSALRITMRLSPASAPRVIEIPVQADYPATCLRNARQIGCDAGGA